MHDNHEDNLTEVSQFLTTFQDYFRGDDEFLGRHVAVKDIQQALEYNDLLEDHIAAQYEVSKDMDDAALKRRLCDIQTALEDISADVKLVHRILKRFEVWMTKDLSQKVFMLNGGAPLLNLPCANSISMESDLAFPRRRRWNKSFTPSSKTLATPPNRWTWREYLRLAHMVSLLPTDAVRTKAQCSTVTATTVLFKGRKEDLKASEGMLLSQSDLCALWVRAQRNTSAWRHLTQLFVIQKQAAADKSKRPSVRIAGTGGPGGKRLVLLQDSDASDEGEPEEECYVAKYCGNRPKTSSTMRKDAGPMDLLVEWAVTNQVVFTHQYIVEGIEESLPHVAMNIPPEAYLDQPAASVQQAATGNSTASAQQATGNSGDNHTEASGEKHQEQAALTGEPSTVKRPSEATVTGEESPPKKKQRTEPSEEEEVQLRRAKQSFILRWFARRNRKVTSILFSKYPDHKLPIYEKLVNRMMGEGVLESVRKTLDQTYDSTDRTLARIDRRCLLMGKYDNEELFHQAVLEALEALKEATSRVSVNEAIEDLQLLSTRFLGDVPREDLVTASDHKTKIEQLRSFQPPWVAQCSGCATCDPLEKLETCDNCEKSFHRDCCEGITDANKSLETIVMESGPLSQVFSIRLPMFRPAPDFVEMDGLEWTRHSIKVNATTQGVQLSVFQSEMCKVALDSLKSGRTMVSKLWVHPLNGACPLATPHKGIIVNGLFSNSPCAEAGVKEGDIITHIKLEDEESFINISDMDSTERITVLKRIKSPAVLRIQRANKPILDISRAWFRDLQRKANKFIKRTFETERIQTFCKDCVSVNTPNDVRNPVEEAKRCLAVVRRIAMESYSFPFHHEEHPADDLANQFHCISLDRLDRMMVSMVESKSVTAGGWDWPFCAPPRLKRDGTLEQRQRLAWLSDEVMTRPMEVLCRGMMILLTPPIALFKGVESDPFPSERAALTSHFLSLFTSWCIRSTFDIGCVATIGPPTDFTNLANPLLVPACQFCMRPLAQRKDTGDFAASCAHDSCQSLIAKMSTNQHRREAPRAVSDSEGDEDADAMNCEEPHTCLLDNGEQTTGERLRRYNYYASLVGTTLLIMPGDPILDIPAHFLRQNWIRAGDRPTPFLVASYLPSHFVNVQPGSCIKAADDKESDRFDGIFHLLPIIYSKQLNYLVKCATMRSLPTNAAATAWTVLPILDLPGVVCLSPRQLLKRLSQTKAASEAISHAVAMHASARSQEELDSLALSKQNHTTCDLPAIARSSDHCEGLEDHAQEIKWRVSCLTAADNSVDELAYFQGAELISGSVIDGDNGSTYSTLLKATVTNNSDTVRSIIDSLSALDNNGSRDVETDETDVESLVAEEDSVSPVEEINAAESSEFPAMLQCDSPEILRVEEPHALATTLHSPIRTQRCNEEPCDDDDEVQVVAGPDVVHVDALQPVLPRLTVGQVSAGQRTTLYQGSPTTQPHPPQPMNPTLPPIFASPLKVSKDDIHIAGAEGTYLTRVECSIVVAALQKGLPALAKRLLCPRYRWEQADEQVRIVQHIPDAASLPVMHDDFIDWIFRCDFKRAQEESGPIIAREHGFEYKMPDKYLPIDALFSKWLEDPNPVPEPHRMRPATPQQIPQYGVAGPYPGPYPAPHPNYYPPNQQNQFPTPPPHRMELQTWHSARSVTQDTSPTSQSQPTFSPMVNRVDGRSTGTDHTVGRGVQMQIGDHRPGSALRISFAAAANRGTTAEEHHINSDFSPPQREVPNPLAPRGVDVSQTSPTQRIRGGGPEGQLPAPEGQLLESWPKSQWGGKLVTAKQETSKGEATVVGFIDEKNMDVDDEGYINVDLIYVSNHGSGLLTDVAQQDILLGSLFVVAGDSDEDKIAKAWRAGQSSVDLGSDATTANEIPPSEASPEIREEASRCDVDNHFVKRLVSKGTRFTLLGTLPDGRRVSWMSSEPQSVRMHVEGATEQLLTAQISEASKSFLDDISSRNVRDSLDLDNTRFCCFWGCQCTTENDRFKPLSFDSVEDLVGHIEKHHLHSSSRGKFLTVSSGYQIKSLASDLVSAACSRWPPLRELTVDADSGDNKKPEFDLKLVLAATKAPTERPFREILKNYPGNKKNLVDMIVLWSRLARLFDLEINGDLKIDPIHFQIRFPAGCYDPTIDDDKEKRSVDGCFAGNVLPEQLEFSQCQLCCADSEEVVRRSGKRGVGIGCALICSARRSQASPIAYKGTCSSLSMSKSILVNLATNMPAFLREKGKQVNLVPGRGLWEEDGRFQQWCKFVENAVSTRMLSQALVVLIRNMHKDKLPDWWRNVRAGWSKPFALLIQPTSSALLLHLYVLDVAIAEFIRASGARTTTLVSDPLPKELKSIPIAKRLEKVVQCAKRFDMQAFDGSHGSFCLRCEDGGDLLCCEYCETVQHGKCCVPEITSASSIGKWVCCSCINEIWEIKMSSGE